MIERENHYRQLFAENPNSSEIQDPHLMLISVFDQPNEFNYQDESDDEVRGVGSCLFCWIPLFGFFSHFFVRACACI
jgi:hypothetical protein